MFLSIIIPLYNCENYISQCLDTILDSQFPFNDYEIIIINDGSKDQGPEKCVEYIRNYNHIRLFSQENKGASTARNKGLEEAQGNYIWFVDADDLIIPSFLNKAYRYLQDERLELLSFNHQKKYTNQIVGVDDFKNELRFSGIEFFKGHYSNFIWNKIYKKTALKNTRFLDGTKNIEDMLFNMCTIIDMNQILCIPEYGYQYNATNMSSTSRNLSLRNLVKLDQDSMTVLCHLKSIADKKGDQEKKNVLIDYLNFSLAGYLYSLFKFYSPNRMKMRIANIRKVGLYPVNKCYNKKANFFLWLANKESLFLWLMRIGLLVKKKKIYRMFLS